MDIGKALTSGFNVLIENPKILLPALIMAVISTLTSTYIGSLSLYPISTGGFGLYDINLFVTLALVVIMTSLINLFLSGMIIRMVYDATRRKLSLSGAAKVVLGKYVTLLISSIVFYIAVIVGVFAFIIPGIFLLIRLLFFEYAILIDNEDVAGSLKKSWRMVKGRWWNVFALVLIIGLISFGLGFFAGILGAFSPILYLIVYFLLILFLSPWVNATLTFAYLQLRGKK